MTVKDKGLRQRTAEHFEPWEMHRRVPLPVIWVAVALGIWGTGTLFHGAGSETVARAEKVQAAAEAVRPTDAPSPGAALFAANCATCHQANGAGVRLAVPPLAGSEFPASGPETVARILLRGIDGPIRVAGSDYDGHMPRFAFLDDERIAMLATHVAERFGGRPDGTAAPLAAVDVAVLRKAADGRQSWAGGAELAGAVAGLPDQRAAVPASSPSVDAAVSGLIFQGRGQVWACASCHGDLGQGTGSTPRLACLPASYIARQLADFRGGHRAGENMRVVASGLSDGEIAGLSTYYAGLRVPSNAAPALGGDLARGEEIALRGDWRKDIPACFSCHGPSGFGVAPDFPALAAQHPAYVAGQLAAWAGGTRGTARLGLMDRISAALPDADRRAIADYLASLAAVPAVAAVTAQGVPINGQ